MIIDEFFDAQTSPFVTSESECSINSIDSNEFNFNEMRDKVFEKILKREEEIFGSTSQRSDLDDILQNHENLLKFRVAIDKENEACCFKDDEPESETESKHKTPKLDENMNEFINPVDKQIMYHISTNHRNFTSDSESMNSAHELSSIKDESLNDDLVDEFMEDDEIESKSFTHQNYSARKSYDTTSMNMSHLKEKHSKKKNRLRRVITKFGRAVKHKKSQEVNTSDSADSDNDQIPNINESSKTIKYKSAHSSQSSNEFDKTQIIQILNSNTEPTVTNSQSIIWSMKFSTCGKLLATAGKDKILRVWVLRSFFENFIDLIKKNNNNQLTTNLNQSNLSQKATSSQEAFVSKPFLIYEGHTEDILDVSWSKNLFILTASSDKTCRLWHVYKSDCLCTFNHQSIVSSISFHPKDDRYFISACLDCKLRLWNISDKVVVLCNDLNNLKKSNSNFITAISFCQGGKLIAVGTFDGKCILYHTENLKYYSLINVRSTRGRNSKGSKITGIECLNNDENKILITSNDSRIRLYDLRDLSLVCKYKGFANSIVHIKACLSPDDKFIVSGSKNKCVYLWKTNYQFSMLTSGRRDRNNYWERIQAHNAIVTCALFAPKPSLIVGQNENETKKNVHIFVSAAGCDGVIKVFLNKPT